MYQDSVLNFIAETISGKHPRLLGHVLDAIEDDHAAYDVVGGEYYEQIRYIEFEDDYWNMDEDSPHDVIWLMRPDTREWLYSKFWSLMTKPKRKTIIGAHTKLKFPDLNTRS